MELSYKDSWQETLGLSYELAKAGKTRFKEDELADKLDLDLNSLWDRLKFAWATHKIYHFRTGEQLAFTELKPGVYVPKVENPDKDCKDRIPARSKRNPLISDKE